MGHGHVKTINGKRVATGEYRSWQMMKNRCHNPRADDWDYYGGRGIIVCDDWHLFENFLQDMGPKPSKLHTLDRIDNDGHYCPQNCRWSTRLDQARNRGAYNVLDAQAADVIRFLYDTGEFYQYEIAEAYGLTQSQISQITRGAAWRETEGPR